jgi:hypothetical protein
LPCFLKLDVIRVLPCLLKLGADRPNGALGDRAPPPFN